MELSKKKSPLVLAHEKTCSSALGSVSDGSLSPKVSISDNDCTTILRSLQEEVSTKFEPKKKSSEDLAGVYRELNLQGRSVRVNDCGSFLEYHVTVQEKKLHIANFCKDRLCPMCNWRRSLKIFGQVSRVMDQLEKDGYCFLFLTLTVKNCSADTLPATVQMLFDGWRKMYNKKSVFQKRIAGTFRSLEVTRNNDTGEFHPHFHVILAVRSDYFTRNYMTQAAWSELWRLCCGLDYNPIVDIRKIKPDSKGLAGAVAEVSKYAVKATDFLQGSMEDKISYVVAFLSALTQRRLCAFTGCFMKVRKQLALDDIEDGNLLNIDGDELREDVAYMVVRYSWRSGVYVREA